MSATIAKNDLSFFIFGSGHDYTLADSGKGEVRWFSHPFMAKGSRAYAGMYYFQVPNEQGEMFDAVKDDIEHCTFTPALGETFDTVGEQEIRVDYYREYPHDEDTLVVEKHLKQTITVVDHGAVASSYYNNIIYADGYCYVNPASDYVSRNNGWWLSGSFKKISSLPWGTESISNISTDIEDASELGFADFSQMTTFKKLFYGCSKLWNIQNFDQIDVSHITNMSQMFYGCDSLVDITPLKTWRTRSVTDFSGFLGATGITNTDGLQGFTFESAYSLYEFFFGCEFLVDLKGISGWKLKGISETARMFMGNGSLKDLTPLKDWDMSTVSNVDSMFAIDGGSKCGKITTLNGLQNWNMSNVRFFTRMFGGQTWLNDISAISGWDVSNGVNFERMLLGVACLTLGALSGWNMARANAITDMFFRSYKVYSEKLGKYVVIWGNVYLDYADNEYVEYEVTPPDLEKLTQDASAISGWSVPSGRQAFDTTEGYATWTNIPAWN